LKGSSATSARATEAPRPTGRLSGKPPLTPTNAEAFALAGPSSPPDPQFNAYRKDLADAALAGRVIASHYAEPVDRRLAAATTLHEAPGAQSKVLAALDPGDRFALLDDSLGWAWGYAGDDHRVGYVLSDALAANHNTEA
jgi:hypothetical protein